jgi:hypothetical protein
MLVHSVPEDFSSISAEHRKRAKSPGAFERIPFISPLPSSARPLHIHHYREMTMARAAAAAAAAAAQGVWLGGGRRTAALRRRRKRGRLRRYLPLLLITPAAAFLSPLPQPSPCIAQAHRPLRSRPGRHAAHRRERAAIASAGASSRLHAPRLGVRCSVGGWGGRPHPRIRLGRIRT